MEESISDGDVPICSSPEIPFRPPKLIVPAKPLLQPKWTLSGHRRGVSCLRFNPKFGKLLCSASADADICLWDAESGRLLKKLHGHRLGVDEVAFSSNGRFLASGSDDETVKVWDIERCATITTFKAAAQKCVFSCAWNSQGNVVAAGGENGLVFYWDLRSGHFIRWVECHFNPVCSVEFHPDSSILLTSSTDGLARIWDTSAGHCLRTFVEQSNPPVGSARFSPNGRYILISHMNGSIKLWDYLRAKCKKTLTGHSNQDFCIPASFFQHRNQTYVVSGSEDRKMYVWHLNRRKVVQTLSGHQDVVIATSCSPSQPFVASAGLEQDPSVRIWAVSS